MILSFNELDSLYELNKYNIDNEMIFSINNFHEIEEIYLKVIFNGNEEDIFFNLVKTEPITNIFKTNNQKKY